MHAGHSFRPSPTLASLCLLLFLTTPSAHSLVLVPLSYQPELGLPKGRCGRQNTGLQSGEDSDYWQKCVRIQGREEKCLRGKRVRGAPRLETSARVGTAAACQWVRHSDCPEPMQGRLKALVRLGSDGEGAAWHGGCAGALAMTANFLVVSYCTLHGTLNTALEVGGAALVPSCRRGGVTCLGPPPGKWQAVWCQTLWT